MALTSPPLTLSPPSTFPASSDSASIPAPQSRGLNGLPMQQAVSSASQLPLSYAKGPSSTSSHMASKQYVEQHRAFVDHQRQLHDEERGLWELERRELHHRITELEELVRRLGGQIESGFFAPLDQPHSRGRQLNNHSGTESRVSSTTSAGDEFWRGAGGRSDAQPTRTFSDSSDRSFAASAASQHLPSISEESRKKSVGFDMGGIPPEHQDFHVHPIPTIPRERLAASFDSITFKPAPFPPAVARSRTTGSQSPSPRSPRGSPAPRRNAGQYASTSAPVAPESRPKVLAIPSLGLEPSELLIRDAGHTPLVRLSDAASNSSSQATPLRPATDETQPRTAQSAPVRPPTERSDSYFPSLEKNEELPTVTEDVHLREPLSLRGDASSRENESFLSQLNSKLLEATRSDSPNTVLDEDKTDALRKVQSAAARLGAEKPKVESEDAEPKLRIKHSMNFGTVFGSSNVGKV